MEAKSIEMGGGVWEHLVSVHKQDAGNIVRQMRCVERQGVLDDGTPVIFLRVFKVEEAMRQGVAVSGWETLDRHPDLIRFEGFFTREGKAYLRRRTVVFLKARGIHPRRHFRAPGKA